MVTNFDAETATLARAGFVMDSAATTLRSQLVARRADLDAALAELAARAPELGRIAECLTRALRQGRKVLAAGNGGSAAEAQHFAGELVGRFKRERQAFAALALTTDSAVLTAIGNDYGFADVFARQVAGLGQPGDALVAFSTSGESDNLLRAARIARASGMAVIAITGDAPSSLERAADLTLRVPSRDTPLTQELHMVVTHLVCEWIESRLGSVGLEPL